MKIIWRDTDLKTHEIDLKNAVDVSVEGILISSPDKNRLRIKGENRITIYPVASNVLDITA